MGRASVLLEACLTARTIGLSPAKKAHLGRDCLVALLDVRRLAAVDMHGFHGSARRRRIIRAEFVVAVPACLGLGVLSLLLSHGWGRVLGVCLIGIGLNYVPLAIHAQLLSRPGALEAELAGVDLPSEARKVGVRQTWLLVPFLVFALSLTDLLHPKGDVHPPRTLGLPVPAW
jgi:hypothetical protein